MTVSRIAFVQLAHQVFPDVSAFCNQQQQAGVPISELEKLCFIEILITKQLCFFCT
jgi:hypothetical protein